MPTPKTQFIKPNKPHIKLWVKALRSGKYKQTKSRLHSGDDEFCCLGVACDVARLNGLKLSRHLIPATNSNPSSYGYGPKRRTKLLPSSVVKWLGFGNESLEVMYKRRPTELAELNDWEGKSFKQIARLIEKTYLGTTAKRKKAA